MLTMWSRVRGAEAGSSPWPATGRSPVPKRKQLIAMQQRTLRDVTEVLREFDADRRAYTARLLELEQRVGGGKSWMSKREGVGAIAHVT